VTDRVARALAASALAVALVALVVAAWAVSVASDGREDVRRLGESLSRALEVGGPGRGPFEVPMRSPRPQLDPDDR
jgi:hypothetical protein